MKISLLTLAVLCLDLLSVTAKANAPPHILADTIIIQFNTGYGIDCRGSGRTCLSAQPMSTTETPSLDADAVAKAWLNEQGHFVLEIRQVLKIELWNELEGGTFLLEADLPVPENIMTALGKQGRTCTLTSGMHLVKKQPDNSYRIDF